MFFEVIAVIALLVLIHIAKSLQTINANMAKWGSEHIKYLNADLLLRRREDQ